MIMRDAKNCEDVANAEGGWLDWLADRGIPAISGVDTRALVRHIRDRGAMRAGIFPVHTTEAEAHQRIASEPLMSGADLARTVAPSEPIHSVERDPTWLASTPGEDEHCSPASPARLPADADAV